ncbi:MAG: hypothetical protein FWH57_06710 [Oscillospiraceae bacterium]|nr:hypothetical protein [Oscillospiraceae bacterium]
MSNYELTERGKIFVAVVLVLLLLLVPSAILLCTAVARQPERQSDPQGAIPSVSPPPSLVITPTPEIPESPQPSGGGLGPSDVPINDDGIDGNDDTSDDENVGAAEAPDPIITRIPDQDGLIPVESVLSFIFSPARQDSLDDKTLSNLRGFVNSPENTDDSSIAIEIPKLSEADTQKLLKVLDNAFTDLGISEQRLVYISDQDATAQDAFEVTLSFIPLVIK